MKQLLLFILISLSVNAFTQKKYSTYTNSFTTEQYSISVSAKDTNDYSLYIDCYSIDKVVDKGGILLNKKQVETFQTALTGAKAKFEEWVKTAKENNVEALSKPMTFNSKGDGYFMYGNDWNFQFGVNLTFGFKVVKVGETVSHLMIVKTGELQSSSNQFIKADGFYIIFSSTEEIDYFISQISEVKVKEFIKKPKAEDLFKD